MEEVKSWYQSKTIWGSVVGLAALVFTAFGHPVAPDVQADIVNWLVAGGGLVGSAIAIWGRVTATAKIG